MNEGLLLRRAPHHPHPQLPLLRHAVSGYLLFVIRVLKNLQNPGIYREFHSLTPTKCNINDFGGQGWGKASGVESEVRIKHSRRQHPQEGVVAEVLFPETLECVWLEEGRGGSYDNPFHKRQAMSNACHSGKASLVANPDQEHCPYRKACTRLYWFAREGILICSSPS